MRSSLLIVDADIHASLYLVSREKAGRLSGSSIPVDWFFRHVRNEERGVSLSRARARSVCGAGEVFRPSVSPIVPLAMGGGG